MDWIDITSYNRNDKERKPTVLECQLTQTLKFRVHKHIYYGDAWLLTAECVGLDKMEIGTTDMEIAKEKAKAIMAERLEAKKSEMEIALAELTG